MHLIGGFQQMLLGFERKHPWIAGFGIWESAGLQESGMLETKEEKPNRVSCSVSVGPVESCPRNFGVWAQRFSEGL